jgi:hypothetical protein
MNRALMGFQETQKAFGMSVMVEWLVHLQHQQQMFVRG